MAGHVALDHGIEVRILVPQPHFCESRGPAPTSRMAAVGGAFV